MPEQATPGRTGPASDYPDGPRTAGSPGPRSYAGLGSYGGYDGYGGYTEGPSGPGGSEVHLVDYLRTIYKHRWLALTVFGVVFLYMAIRTFQTTPVFEARVQLLLDPETPNVMSFKDGTDAGYGYGYEEYYYQTQYTILKSRGLARRTLDALKMWDAPEFGGGSSTGGKAPDFMGHVKAPLRWVKGLISTPSTSVPTSHSKETARQSGVIDAFLGRLTVIPVKNSRLVDVRLQSANAEAAATMANALATEFIAQNLEHKFRSTREAAEWLSDQLAQERKKLEESEQALQRYREQGDAVALEDRQNIVVQRLTDLNAAYTKARTDRFEKEALYTQLKGLETDRAALDTFPAILSNTFIQQLKSQLADLQRQQAQLTDRLGEKHPEMIKIGSAIQNTEAKLSAELAKVVQSVRNEFLSAQAQERSLADALSAQKEDALSLNKTGIEYGVLRREAESNKQMYELLMQRAKETDIAGELKTSNIRVVDQAEVPRSPIRPNRPRDILIGLLMGLTAGVGLAFFVEYLDNRVKSPEEIKQHLGLSFLGLIPALRDEEIGPGGEPLITAAVPQSFSEAFRGIRTNVMFSSADEGARSVLVTSTQPQEGKTVVAANLAISLAHSGQRILLIDADMRKPRQHDLMEVPKGPGLSSLLVGTVKVNDAVRKTGVGNLWVLPAGPNPPNPAELLGSNRFRELLAALGQHFDWLVIDSPPVNAVTDASVIAHRTTGVVFVIGSEQVDRHTVRSSIEQLLNSKATILGAVLNRVNIRKNPYYYANYYRHDYSGYYTSEERA